MARINNLTNFLDDVATAIKQKTGDNTPIPASEFDTEILSIETAGTYQQKTLTITQNGQTTLTPDTGFDAMDQVAITVNVPTKQLQSKTVSVTSNGNVTLLPDTDYDGFNEVNLQVNVPSGSGDVKLFETEQAMQADPNPSEGDLAVVYRDELVPPSPGDTFRYFSPPATVIFDTPITTTTTLTIGTFIMVLNCTLTPTGFSVSGRAAVPASVTITYTSSDGVTYTKVAGEDDYDMGSNQTISSSADVNILKFLPTNGKMFEGLYEYNSTQYVIADSQLDVTADYVYKKEFYGTNGVETGTLTTSVNNSFADVNAEVMSKIQKQYDNMTPRVLTDSDKTINKGICIIPMKFDGTLLLDTAQVTNMNSMFYNCTSLVFVPLLNTSNVTNMNSMFSSCSSLVTISQLNTSSVITMQNMFKDCTSLTSIPLLNTSNVTNMTQMFFGCTSLTTIPLLNTSNVTNMNYMFGGCSSLTSIPLLDTSNVTSMGTMFSGCSSLTTIPLLDTSKATSLIIMFNGCTSLSNGSLDNILAMCIGATSYTGAKTLKQIGLTSTQATTCQSLSNWSAFVAAGWTTGY